MQRIEHNSVNGRTGRFGGKGLVRAGAKKATGGSRRNGGKETTRQRLVRVLLKAAVFLAMLPLEITLVYSILPAVSTPMLARLLTGQKVERIWTPLDTISLVLQRSVIALRGCPLLRSYRRRLGCPDASGVKA